jgi:outer membrane protein OmpA-like peptidoglycan-associated protein
MEVKTQQSKTAVNSGAKAGDPMDSSQAGSYEDLGGPSPENYKPDDDSAKLKEPKIKTVADVVNKGAKSADAMQKMSKEETETTEEVVAEEEVSTEEVVAESEETTEEAYDMDEDVNALLGGEELSEEAKEELKTSLVERVDSYLEYVCEEWMTENELAVEHGIKSEMTESFLSGMKSLFEEHYVTIPEDKYDVLESMVEKLDEMETKLNEQIDKNIDLNKRLAESTADSILDQISEGLAATQKEKLASLAESVEFESEDEYREKLETLRESYFSSKAPAPKVAQQQTLSEGVDTTEAPVTGTMDAYLRSLGAFKK